MSAREAHDAIEQILSHEARIGERRQAIRAWASEYGIDESLVLLRVSAGWDLRKALTEPLGDKPILPKGRDKKRSSRFLGVTRHGTRKGRWYARINNGGKTTELGTSESEFIAATLFNIASRNRDGIAARVNLI
jgi:hypothetical protein